MKASIYLSALLLLTLLFVSVSCNKGNMTDEDKDWNILEWRVDGEKYKATCSAGTIISGCDPVDCQYYNDDKYLHIRGASEKGGIIIHKYRGLKIGNSNILTNSDYIKYYDRIEDDRQCIEYIVDTTNEYNLTINDLDTINKIITGRFHFTSFNDCQNIIKVTDGYFKLSYRP